MKMINTASNLSPGISSGPRKRATTRQHEGQSPSTYGEGIPIDIPTMQRRWKRSRQAQWREFLKLQVVVIGIGVGSVLLGLYWLLMSVSEDQPAHSNRQAYHNPEHPIDHRRMSLQIELPTLLRKDSKGKRKHGSQSLSTVFVGDPIPTIAIKLPTPNITVHSEEPAKEHSSSGSGDTTNEDTPAESLSGPDYGGLAIDNQNPMAPRQILFATYSDMLDEVAREKTEDKKGDNDDWLSGDEDYNHYYAFDDDFLRGRRVGYDGVNPEENAPSSCRRVSEHRISFPTCNELHQMDYAAGRTLESNLTYLNHGAFREVFSVDHSFRSFKEKIAIKEIRYKLSNADMEIMEYVRMDAIVAERLTSSPRTFDVYGYCGLSLLSEFFYHGDIEDHVYAGEKHKAPDTLITPEQKLVLALEMAESLADLHGYSNGMILHSDVQLGQFLLNKDKTRLKLNDFNRAEFLLWDETNQAYCQHRNGKGHGNWRSPEEYRNDPLTDKIDVWSLGNNIYTILTGVEPILADDDDVETSQLLIQGKTGRLDPKYFQNDGPERVLATTIQQCFHYDPIMRPTIFEVVQRLQWGVNQVERRLGITRQAILQQL